MRIVTVRRISQGFFLLLLLWFCLVSTMGAEWWQIRGWPVSWFLELDPLVALGTMVSTHTLYRGLLWSLVTVGLTILLGRFFCSWVCPFGTIHHLVGFLGNRGKPLAARVASNQYRRGQRIKYYLLTFLLTAAAGSLMVGMVRIPAERPVLLVAGATALLLGGAALALSRGAAIPRRYLVLLPVLLGAWIGLGFVLPAERTLVTSLQTGLLDPIPLVQRSLNLALLPLFGTATTLPRYYEGAWLIGAVFLAAVFANLWVPRFYCRFVCPLGALMGVLGRFALWRIGRRSDACKGCQLCEAACEGACEPTAEIRISECVLCMNCVDSCRHELMGYRTVPSASGERTSPDIGRRGLLLSFASGVAAIPMVRLSGLLGTNWNPGLIRPPGSLAEPDFLKRCIKCGQCMRICPTNIIHPAGMEGGLEGLWTPLLNFRIGKSGCQLRCVACGHLCPTGAIRPLSLEEKLGRKEFAESGPIRVGTAFVDQGRCLPWAMDRPCIVCQENCPISPKAIFTREHYSTVRGGIFVVEAPDPLTVVVAGRDLEPGRLATGDYYCTLVGGTGEPPRRIVDNTRNSVTVAPGSPWVRMPGKGSSIAIQVRLQRPYVDPALCTGCGICEHECPVSGKRAIRVSAENESRSRRHSLTPKA
jgi:polyferredoxin/formate hydrogenlyase subunit 6/NADH:ubiquinone oxidoreductase subunit I